MKGNPKCGWLGLALMLLTAPCPVMAADPKDQAAADWWLTPCRMIQTNLREIDVDMDVAAYVASLKAAGANVVLFNVGGIVANYPTDLSYHYRNPQMKGDFIGEVVNRLHAEGIRMAYYGYWGNKERADHHRKQGEVLALQGGLSWSAFTMFSIRAAYIAMLTQDTLGVLAASADLERLSTIAPNALWYRDLCLAYVATTRGHPDQALPTYERLAAHPSARLRPTFEYDASYHAQALVLLGRAEEAKAICEAAIQRRIEFGANAYSLRTPTQQLALVEAALGDTGRGKALLQELLGDSAATRY